VSARHRDIGFGIVGAGLVAAVHATALSRIPGARVAAVTGSSPGSERAARLAADHGGRVEVRSGDGETTFTIVLPTS